MTRDTRRAWVATAVAAVVLLIVYAAAGGWYTALKATQEAELRRHYDRQSSQDAP